MIKKNVKGKSECNCDEEIFQQMVFTALHVQRIKIIGFQAFLFYFYFTFFSELQSASLSIFLHSALATHLRLDKSVSCSQPTFQSVATPETLIFLYKIFSFFLAASASPPSRPFGGKVMCLFTGNSSALKRWYGSREKSDREMEKK